MPLGYGRRLVRQEILRPDLVGDGLDEERLLTAAQVASVLQVPRKSVYELPIRRIRLGPRRVRWRWMDIEAFLDRRTEKL